MTREETKKLLPIIQAFAEGKIVQIKDKTGKWNDLYEPCWNYSPDKYRIKPEPKFRPFKNQEECWNELQNHTPYGILKNKESGRTAEIYGLYTEIRGNKLKIAHSDTFGNCCETANSIYYRYEFKDGTPFGIKEDR